MDDLPNDLMSLAEAAEVLGLSVDKLKALSTKGFIAFAPGEDGTPLMSPSHFRAQFRETPADAKQRRQDEVDQRSRTKQTERAIAELPTRKRPNEHGPEEQ